MQYNMNQQNLMNMMVMKTLSSLSPDFIAQVEAEAKKRGMSDADIQKGKEYIMSLAQRKEV